MEPDGNDVKYKTKKETVVVIGYVHEDGQKYYLKKDILLLLRKLKTNKCTIEDAIYLLDNANKGELDNE